MKGKRNNCGLCQSKEIKNNSSLQIHRIGALAKYRCERGYKIIGEPLVSCEETGLWSGQVPECICKLFSLNMFESTKETIH